MKLTDLPPLTIDRDESQSLYEKLHVPEKLVVLYTPFDDMPDKPEWYHMARVIEHLDVVMELRAAELKERD